MTSGGYVCYVLTVSAHVLYFYFYLGRCSDHHQCSSMCRTWSDVIEAFLGFWLAANLQNTNKEIFIPIKKKPGAEGLYIFSVANRSDVV